jgi:hypothetical protein
VIFKDFMAALARTNYLFLDVTPCYLIEIRSFKASAVCRLIDWYVPTFRGGLLSGSKSARRIILQWILNTCEGEGVNWMHVGQYSNKWRAVVSCNVQGIHFLPEELLSVSATYSELFLSSE